MADWAHEWTDERIAELERKFEVTYAQAAKEMREKLDTYLEGYGDRNDQWKADVSDGKATQEQYVAWLKGQSTRREYLIDMTNALAEDAANTDQLAADYINNELPNVFTENANWTAYQIERQYGTAHSFALYDRDTVRRVMGMTEHDQIMHEVIPVGPPNTPLQSLRVHPERAKDVRWNRQRFTASIVQSILQGESIPNTAKRLERVLTMDKGMATRAARTAMTSAENAGRVDSYRRAVDMGLQVEQRWMATLDLRTRQSHRELDKQHVPVGEYFVVPSNGHKLRFPADPAADGSETWNCRCTLVAWFPDSEEDVDRWSRLPKGMTYDEWKQGKKQEQKEYQYTSGSSQIWGQLGDNDPVAVRKKVDQMLQGSAGIAAKVWQKYESQLKLFDPEGNDGDYFMAGRGVSVHLANDMEGKGVQGNVMGVFFHEFGHHIDNIVDHVWGASNTYGRGEDEHGTFPDTLVKEVSAALERKREETARRMEAAIKNVDIDELVNIGAVNKAKQAFAVFDVKYYLDLLDDEYVDMAEEDLGLSLSSLSMKERRKAVFDYYRKNGLSVSMPDESELGYQLGLDITRGGHDMQVALGDIYDGATKGVVFDTFGHGKTYWGEGNNSRLAEEAFAEFFSAECIYSENPKVLDIMKKYLPESYSVYREIMESIL